MNNASAERESNKVSKTKYNRSSYNNDGDRTRIYKDDDRGRNRNRNKGNGRNKNRNRMRSNKRGANTDIDNMSDYSDNSFGMGGGASMQVKQTRLKRENSTPNTRSKKNKKQSRKNNGKKGKHDHSKSVALIDSEYYNFSNNSKIIATANTSIVKKRISKLSKIATNRDSNKERSALYNDVPSKGHKRKSHKYKKRQSTKQSMDTTNAAYHNTSKQKRDRDRDKSRRHRKTATAAYIDDSDNDYISHRPIYHAGTIKHSDGKYEPQPPHMPAINPVIQHGASADLVNTFHHENGIGSGNSNGNISGTNTNTITQTFESHKHSLDDPYGHGITNGNGHTAHTNTPKISQMPITNPYYVVDDHRNATGTFKHLSYSPSPSRRKRTHKESDFHSNDDIVIITKSNGNSVAHNGHHGLSVSPVFVSQRTSNNSGTRPEKVILPGTNLEHATMNGFLSNDPPYSHDTDRDRHRRNHKAKNKHHNGHRSKVPHRDSLDDSFIGSPYHNGNYKQCHKKQNEMESRIEILENENIVLKSDVRKLKRAVRELTNTVQQIMQTLQQQ